MRRVYDEEDILPTHEKNGFVEISKISLNTNLKIILDIKIIRSDA